MAIKKAKALTASMSQAMERRVMEYIAQIEQARTQDELEDAAGAVQFVIQMMVEEGYHPIAAEGFQARARKVAAESRHAQGVALDKPVGVTASGFDLLHFREKLRGIQAILPSYTPAEFARECARMARRSDPRVLTEDEFQ